MFKEISEVSEVKEIKVPTWLKAAASKTSKKDLNIDKPLVNVKKDVKASE